VQFTLAFRCFYLIASIRSNDPVLEFRHVERFRNPATPMSITRRRFLPTVAHY
jgi:hypothetical protein